MRANGFREDELITRRVNNQSRVFPVVGGRLRLAHEENEALSLQTEMVTWDGQYAVFRCRAVTAKGDFVGYGTANTQRDARLAESLIELAETRSIARALRFAGYGLEYCGAEEVSHVMENEPQEERTAKKRQQKVFVAEDQEGKLAQRCANSEDESKRSRVGTDRATQAQCRALYALTRKARYTEEDIASLLGPLNATAFEQLTRESASQLISYLQTEVAA